MGNFKRKSKELVDKFKNTDIIDLIGFWVGRMC